MNKEEVKELVFQEWEKWKKEPKIEKTETPEKQTFGQWLIKKLNIKVPDTSENLRDTFVCRFFADNRDKLKGIFFKDILNWIKEKESLDLLVGQKMKMYEEVRSLIIPHLDTLLKKRNRFLIKDDYGFIDQTKWQKELDYFIDRAIISHLEESIATVVNYTANFRFINNPELQKLKYGLNDFPDILEDVKECINDVLDCCSDEKVDRNIDISLLDPTEYEHYCADILRENGWDVRVTQGSGDQGIDVLAEKDGFLLAIQCKKYSNPVGNKAVQEAHSGGTFYNASAFAVVSPVEYTPSARELANSLGVHLFHHDDLATLTIKDKKG